MKWAGKQVLVTGAGGFIGSHLVDHLVRADASVRAFVRYNGRGTFGWLHDLAPDVYKSIEITQGDLRDADNVLRAVKGREIILHLGAMIAIPYSYVNPTEAIAVNVTGTLNVLNACRLFGIERLVHTSTSETYGTAQYVPIDEKHPLVGQSPYSASKIGADKLAESFHRSFNVPVVTVRPFNTYGPRQSARAVIPTIIAQLLSGDSVVLGSLTPTRDFTYVDDTVLGMIAAAGTADAEGKTINLGNMREITIASLAEKIAQICGTNITIRQSDERKRPEKSEVERLFSDTTLANNLLGWRPAVDLETGLTRTISWMREHLADYRRAQTEYVI